MFELEKYQFDKERKEGTSSTNRCLLFNLSKAKYQPSRTRMANDVEQICISWIKIRQKIHVDLSIWSKYMYMMLSLLHDYFPLFGEGKRKRILDECREDRRRSDLRCLGDCWLRYGYVLGRLQKINFAVGVIHWGLTGSSRFGIEVSFSFWTWRSLNLSRGLASYTTQNNASYGNNSSWNSRSTGC